MSDILSVSSTLNKLYMEQKDINLQVERLQKQLYELHNKLSCEGHVFVPLFPDGNGGMDVCFEKCMMCGVIHTY